MKLNELRIGNLIGSIHGDGCTYTNVDCALFCAIEGERLLKEDLAPIQLTETWLIKAGFGDELDWVKRCEITQRSYILDTQNRFILADRTGYGLIVSRGIEYVHQLQNVMYMLTGKELEFNG